MHRVYMLFWSDECFQYGDFIIEQALHDDEKRIKKDLICSSLSRPTHLDLFPASIAENCPRGKWVIALIADKLLPALGAKFRICGKTGTAGRANLRGRACCRGSSWFRNVCPALRAEPCI
jgi:hypothetical protein